MITWIFVSIAKVILFYRSLKRHAHICIFHPLFLRCGKNVTFDPSNSSFSYTAIELGSNIFIGGNAYWSASSCNIVVGDFVMFGSGTKLIAGDHATDRTDIPMFGQKNNRDAGIIIEDDVWIGADSIILKGVCVGKGSIIGAGSVVTKSIDPYSVVVGNPAKVVKSRK